MYFDPFLVTLKALEVSPSFFQCLEDPHETKKANAIIDTNILLIIIL